MTYINEPVRVLPEALQARLPRILREPPPDWALSLPDTVALIRKGTWPRVGFSLLIALISVSFLPPLHAAAWGAFTLVWELVLCPAMQGLVVQSTSHQRIGFRWLAAGQMIGTIGYCVFPVLAWNTHSPLAMVVATAWVCASAAHNFVYFATHRLLLAVTIGPLALVGAVMPFATAGFTLTSAISAFVLVALTAAAGLFGHDRRVLLDALTEQAAARVTAEDSSSTKSQFLATMSHELRTPLNAVIGYAEMIEEDSDGAIANDARQIRDSARRLLGLINVMLEISRLEAGDAALHSEPVDVAALARDIRTEGRALASVNNNSLIVIENGQLGEAFVDASRLHQCVMQLVSNAAKFTRDGEINVGLARETRDGRDALVFVVADTGVGIAPEHLNLIFEPFTQGDESASRRYEGAGVGLAYARQIARLMGGDITVVSAPGQGSTFTLTVRAITRPGS